MEQNIGNKDWESLEIGNKWGEPHDWSSSLYWESFQAEVQGPGIQATPGRLPKLKTKPRQQEFAEKIIQKENTSQREIPGKLQIAPLSIQQSTDYL